MAVNFEIQSTFMLEINITYQKLTAGKSSLRAGLMYAILRGLRHWDNLWSSTAEEEAWHYTTLEMYPLGSLGRDLSSVLSFTGQTTLRSSNMHQQLLHLFFPIFNPPQMASAIPFVLLANGKIQKRILLLCSFCWMIYVKDRSYFKAAFELGKSLNKFTRWDIRHLLREPSAVVQAMLIKESVGESEAPLW